MPQTPYNAPVGVKYQNISATGTVAVKTTGGLLDSILINNVGTAAVLAMYDGPVAGGTVIGTIDVSASFVVPGGIQYGLTFNNGLTIVQTGTAANITVAYD